MDTGASPIQTQSATPHSGTKQGRVGADLKVIWEISEERCVWMARKMTEWPSKRGPITKIMPSDGCKGDTVPVAVGRWYNFHEFGWHLGNVG